MNNSDQALLHPEGIHYLPIFVGVGVLLAMLIAGSIYFFGGDRLSVIAPSSSSAVNSTPEPALDAGRAPFSYELKAVAIEDPPGSFFAINNIQRYSIAIAEGMNFELTVAGYIDSNNEQRQAVVYLPPETDGKGDVVDKEKVPVRFRSEKWLSARDAINTYTNSDSLFVSFWDNAQRIHLFTGRDNWVTLPARDAYTEDETALWHAVAGGFDRQGRSVRFSQLLLLDVEEALRELKKELPRGRDHYLLLSTDDLSHVQEIARIAGRGLPLETRLFPVDADLHNNISQVKQWAEEGEGTGSYLVQSVSEQSIRVWRITDESFENTLLARLLPFSTSFDVDIEGARLVYQSDWGGYISIYQLVE